VSSLLVRFWASVCASLARWKLLALAVVVDILFFYSFGKMYAFVFERVSAGLGTVNGLLQVQLEGLASSGDVSGLVSRQAELEAAYAGVFKWIGVLLLALLACWIVFQGVAWLLARRIAGDRLRAFAFVASFARSSLVWFGLFLAVVLGMSFVSYGVSTSPVPLVGQRGMNLLSGILVLVVLYFAVWSYDTEIKPVRSAFVRGVKDWRRLVPAYLVSLAVLASAGWLVPVLFRLHYLALVMFILLVLLPLMTVVRVFMVLSSRSHGHQA